MKILTFNLFLIIQTITEIYSNEATLEFKQHGNLIKYINEIYHGVNATTLVIFNYETKENEMWFSMENVTKINLWQKLEQPKLLLHKESLIELRKYFNNHVLTVVVKQEYLNVWDWEHFTKAMKRWTRTDILFVRNVIADDEDDDETTNGKKDMLEFFRTCGEKGFFKVLLGDFKGEHLYTFTPYPMVKVEEISVTEYLKRHKSLPVVQGYPIRTSAGNNPPRSFVYYNEFNELEYRGVAPHLVNTFARYYNFTVDWILMPNFESIGMTDCSKLLLTDTVDICSEFVPFNEQSYTIAYPIYIVYGFVMVPFAPPIPKSKYLLHPFHVEIWCLMILSLISATAVMSLINRFKSGCWQTSSQLIKSLQFLLYIAPSLPAHWGLQKYLLFFIFIPCAFIITNLYITFLTSIFTSNIYETQINSLDDLKQRQISILITEADMEILRLYNSFESISDNYLKIDVASYVDLRNSLNTHFAYINFEDKCEFYLYQQKFLQRPRLRVMSKPLSALWANIPMKDNWPFMDLFNHYILLMFDTGVVRYLQEQSKEDGIRLGYIQFMKTEYRDVAPLSLEYLEVPTILLTMGYLCGFISFIIENLLYLKKKIKMLL